jgi:glycosyltransferase involved in cell wall biosynthesis
MKIKYSLIIPSFNEEKNLTILFGQIQDLLRDFESLECIFVNNGSTDMTEIVVEKFLATNDRLRYKGVNKNVGYGDGIREGLSIASGEVIAWTHADLQTNLEDIRACIKIWESGSDNRIYVKGRRIRRGLFDKTISSAMSFFNLMFNRVWIHDINGQPNMLKRDSLSTLEFYPSDGTFELYVMNTLISTSDIKLVRIPVAFHKRRYGTGANQFIKDKMEYSLRSIKVMYQMRKNVNH